MKLQLLFQSTAMPASAAPLPAFGLPADVWRAHALAGAVAPVRGSGEALLDAQLPGAGWPVGALIEILQPLGCFSEWRLLLPALARCGCGAVVLVAAPHVPFAASLQAQGLASRRLLWVSATAAAERLWAAEQALRCAEVDAVLVWLVQARPAQLRRLQMAATDNNKLLFAMRPDAAGLESSPAVLRLRIAPADTPDAALAVELVKRRGPLLAEPLSLPARPARLARLLASTHRTEDPHALDRTAVQG